MWPWKLKIGLSYSNQNGPEIYRIHPRGSVKSEKKSCNQQNQRQNWRKNSFELTPNKTVRFVIACPFSQRQFVSVQRKWVCSVNGTVGDKDSFWRRHHRAVVAPTLHAEGRTDTDRRSESGSFSLSVFSASVCSGCWLNCSEWKMKCSPSSYADLGQIMGLPHPQFSPRKHVNDFCSLRCFKDYIVSSTMAGTGTPEVLGEFQSRQNAFLT